MYSITIKDKSLNIFDLFYDNLKIIIEKDNQIFLNPYFYNFIENLEEEKLKKLSIYKDDLIENLKNILEKPFSPQLEDDLNYRLDLIRILYHFKKIDKTQVITHVIDIEKIISDNPDINPFIFLKFFGILFNFKEMGLGGILKNIREIQENIKKRLNLIIIDENSTKSQLFQSIFLLLSDSVSYILFNEINKIGQNSILTNKCFEIISSKNLIFIDFSEWISFNFSIIKILNLNENILYEIIKTNIKEYFEKFLFFNQFSFGKFLKLWNILLNLSINNIQLNIFTNYGEYYEKKSPFPLEQEIFFYDDDKRKIHKDIHKLIDELHACFNLDCLISCKFLIRRIIESSIHIKAIMDQKINEFKNSKGDFIKLENFPEVTYKLDYINKSQKRVLKKLIKYGDVGIHNYRIEPKKEILREKILSLREIVLNIFYNV